MVGNRPESPAGIYINPGGLEGVRVRINRFTAPAKGVRVWQFTVRYIFKFVIVFMCNLSDLIVCNRVVIEVVNSYTKL